MNTHLVQFCIQYASIGTAQLQPSSSLELLIKCILALLYYDYVLTFPAEVKYIWRAKFHFATILYILCRYALLANVLYLLAIAHILEKVRFIEYDLNLAALTFDAPLSVFYHGHFASVRVAGRAAVLTTFTMRTYVDVYHSISHWHVTGTRCSGPTPPEIHIASTALSIAVCVFEWIGTTITALRCVQALKVQERWMDSIMYLVLSEGLLYFGGVSLFTVSAVVLNFEAPDGFLGRLLNALTLPYVSVLFWASLDAPDLRTTIHVPDRISGLLSARLFLHFHAWNDDHRVSGDTIRAVTTLQSFHATGFGGDPLDTLDGLEWTDRDNDHSLKQKAEDDESDMPTEHVVVPRPASVNTHTFSDSQSYGQVETSEEKKAGKRREAV
ncbi:uncharacterized protein FIBRA_01668 [Fibroporia radiculosa]|uniref:DUF6533 domain-containing protein n=1 Tax=Fibroporia radiculosa TaxID=599839 RepID=J4G142_9APHY|nr:uncharacterized protein FIBRA_01668 [Fibroporia radiculosa]CCL99648.1 predicted protein [Fibroporia radiculosa]